MISTIYKSLVRSVNDFIDVVIDRTGDEGVTYWSWEARGDENDMPTQTVIGLDGYSFHQNKGLWIIRCGVTVSTYNDANLLNEADILDIAYELFGEQKGVALRDPDTGDIISELLVSNFDIMPMGQSELRNYRTIGLELKRTQSDG